MSCVQFSTGGSSKTVGRFDRHTLSAYLCDAGTENGFVEGQPSGYPHGESFPLSTAHCNGQAASIVLVLYLVFGAPAWPSVIPYFLFPCR